MSSQPAAARDRSTPLHRGLPEEITIWEILVRLPPKALLRCRTVCRAWHRATSDRDFLLAHHGRQSSLPIVSGYEHDGKNYYQNLLTFDHRATEAQLQHIVRLDEIFCLDASCDGIFILSVHARQYYVRNPATRQSARLGEIDGFRVLGMYQHAPTGQYRLLLHWDQRMGYENPTSGGGDGLYVFALGSGQPPRHIGCLKALDVVFDSTTLLFRGNLHWNVWKSAINMIMVFDTIAESFCKMPSPVADSPRVFEMDGMLGVYKYWYGTANIDIWILQDYETAVRSSEKNESAMWAVCRVELPVAEIRAQFEGFDYYSNVVVTTSCNGDVLVLVGFGEWLLQVDFTGKLVASFHCEGIDLTKFCLKQTLVPHTFFPTIG